MNVLPEGWAILEGDPNPSILVDREVLRSAWVCIQGQAVRTKIQPLRPNPYANAKMRFPEQFRIGVEAATILRSLAKDLQRRKNVIKLGGDLLLAQKQVADWKEAAIQGMIQNGLLEKAIRELEAVSADGKTFAVLKAHCEAANGALERAQESVDSYMKELKRKADK